MAGMKLLGALIAGGQSRRFGSDKALAPLEGKPMLTHVIEGLAPQVDTLVICGRDWPGFANLADRPEPDQGPLGGLNAALRYAGENGFDAVLTASCDTLPVPQRLASLLGEEAAVIKDQPLFGFWPANLAGRLDEWLNSQPGRDMRGWIDESGAVEVEIGIAFSNVNTQADYARLTAQEGLTE